ncbi:MAG: serine/threonine-protein kinase [Nannocystaceae bacterium]
MSDGGPAQQQPSGEDETLDATPRELPDVAAPRPLQPGAAIGGYRIRARLGAGAMGVVYRAFDTRLQRDVALKLLAPLLPSDPEGAVRRRDRLLREAQALAQVRDPHVVTVYEVGEVREEIFVAMELIDGVDMRQWLEGGPRRTAEIVDVFIDAGLGLAAAHAAGLVHRDFKPANVLVGRDGRARVGDFGLARGIDRSAVPVEDPAGSDDGSSGSTTDVHTQTGVVMGTPYYMAPEQMRGAEADQASDQYAFCVALYTGLFGQGPFPRLGVQALADAKGRGAMLQPPEHANVPQWLTELLWRGLDPDPARRFPSVQALLQAIEHRRGRRRRRVRATLAVGAVTLALASGLAVGQLRPDDAASGVELVPLPPAVVVTGPPVLAFEPFVVPADESVAWAGDGLPNLMDEELAGREGLRAIPYFRFKTALSTVDSQRHASIAEAFGATAIVRGHLRSREQGYELAIELRALDGTVQLSRTVLTESGAGGPAPRDEAARAELERLRAALAHARALERAGRYDDALREADALVQPATATGDDRLQADVALLRGDAADCAARGDEALAAYATAAQAAGRAEAPAAAAIAIAGTMWVHALLLGQPEHAQPLEDAATAFAAMGHDAFATGTVARTRGAIAYRRGEWIAARDHFSAAIEAYTAALGEQHPTVAMMLMNRGAARRSAGDLDGADADLQRAEAIARASLHPDHPDVSVVLESRAILETALGRPESAFALQREVVAMRERELGPDHPMTMDGHVNLAAFAAQLHRYDEMLAHADLAIAAMERARAPDHPAFAAALMQRGEALAELGRAAEAIPTLERALALQADAPRVDRADTELALGRALRKLGRADATAHLEAARAGYIAAGKQDSLNFRLTEAALREP